MTEKEFIEEFLKFKDSIWKTALTPEQVIELFLSNFHKEYYEVEFVRKQETLYGIPYFLDNDCMDKDKAYLVRDGKILGHITEFDFKPEEELVTPNPIVISPNDGEFYVKRVSPISLTAEEIENHQEQMKKYFK